MKIKLLPPFRGGNVGSGSSTGAGERRQMQWPRRRSQHHADEVSYDLRSVAAGQAGCDVIREMRVLGAVPVGHSGSGVNGRGGDSGDVVSESEAAGPQVPNSCRGIRSTIRSRSWWNIGKHKRQFPVEEDDHRSEHNGYDEDGIDEYHCDECDDIADDGTREEKDEMDVEDHYFENDEEEDGSDDEQEESRDDQQEKNSRSCRYDCVASSGSCYVHEKRTQDNALRAERQRLWEHQDFKSGQSKRRQKHEQLQHPTERTEQYNREPSRLPSELPRPNVTPSKYQRGRYTSSKSDSRYRRGDPPSTCSSWRVQEDTSVVCKSVDIDELRPKSRYLHRVKPNVHDKKKKQTTVLITSEPRAVIQKRKVLPRTNDEREGGRTRKLTIKKTLPQTHRRLKMEQQQCDAEEKDWVGDDIVPITSTNKVNSSAKPSMRYDTSVGVENQSRRRQHNILPIPQEDPAAFLTAHDREGSTRRPRCHHRTHDRSGPTVESNSIVADRSSSFGTHTSMNYSDERWPAPPPLYLTTPPTFQMSMLGFTCACAPSSTT